ncbi:alpha/beta hydrolase [Sphingosinicella rhizophila]|uniref:Alpha/beta hydrolase n=1 Tax=Sphingosinicella rhizophila TaxID=3050082 RepID=A0ABU3QA13_9SPHN|nr:alpha/beta hydrolase [Sphingosinicella sp. GR2756]MDT9599833.1 alpha/beta hydrolase [Sphingosinicella sp. GR2756]
MLRSESAAKPALMAQALAGLRAYQEAPRGPAAAAKPALASRHGAALRDYGGEGPAVLFVPSLINPPRILDLGRDRSLLRWLADRGHRVLLLDWGWAEERADLSVAGHVEQILLPLMAELGEAPHLVGYCLGGTMTMAAAQLAEVRSLATIAAPWRFAGFPDEARTGLGALWRGARGTAERLGVLPMEVLQSAFWSLDPARTVGKFAAFADMAPDSAEAAAFVALEDWANDGPPIPIAAAREMFEDFLEADRPGKGEWHVGGQRIDPATLACPRLEIVSTSDRIVPEASAVGGDERLALTQGHVGMVIGGSARRALWQPLAAWIDRAGRQG